MIKTRPFNWDEYDPKIHEVRTRCGNKVTELRMTLSVDTCDGKQALIGLFHYYDLTRIGFWNRTGIYNNFINGSDYSRDLVFWEEVCTYEEIEKISKQNKAYIEKQEIDYFLMCNYVFIFVVVLGFLLLLFLSGVK